MESAGVSIHDYCCLLFECKAESAVEVFANRSVGGSGSRHYFARYDLVNSTPFTKGYDCEYIIVPLNKILAIGVKEFRKRRDIRTLKLTGSNLFCEGIFGCSSLLCCRRL